ncbi:MAG TPA: sugar ABC transporter substrate-binding protein [Chloroflexota bacterium]|nr:sugar ABC transporter substrate-binding protein [Chloroflexota bacterium]
MRRAISRRVLLASTAAAGAAGAAALAACAGPGTPQPDAAAMQPARVTVMFPGGGSEDDDFKPVFEAFHQKYPKITAEWTPGGTGGYNDAYTEKLTSLFAAGSGADVFKTTQSFGSFAESGTYKPLDDYIKKHPNDVKMEDYFSQHVEAGKYKGKQLSLSHDGAPQGLWINTDAFQREGITPPSWDTTWQQFLDMALRLTRRDGGGSAQQLGFGRPGWLFWLWGAGGDLYTPDGTRFLIDQPASIEALTWLQDAVQKHRVCPNPQEQADTQLSDFRNGRIAMVFGARGNLGNFRAIESFGFDAAPIPRGPRGRFAQLGAGHTSIWSGSKSPDPAFTTLAFICSADGQRLKISRGYAHPSRKSLVDQDWFKEFKAPKSVSNKINTVWPETLRRNEARAAAPHPREADIMRVANAQIASIWSGAKTPREIAQSIISEASQFLVR